LLYIRPFIPNSSSRFRLPKPSITGIPSNQTLIWPLAHRYVFVAEITKAQLERLSTSSPINTSFRPVYAAAQCALDLRTAQPLLFPLPWLSALADRDTLAITLPLSTLIESYPHIPIIYVDKSHCHAASEYVDNSFLCLCLFPCISIELTNVPSYLAAV